jgi:hypothetical protein
MTRDLTGQHVPTPGDSQLSKNGPIGKAGNRGAIKLVVKASRGEQSMQPRNPQLLPAPHSQTRADSLRADPGFMPDNPVDVATKTRNPIARAHGPVPYYDHPNRTGQSSKRSDSRVDDATSEQWL